MLVILTACLSGAEVAERVDWMRLRGLNYRTGRITTDVQALDGKLIKMAGYVVPLQDDVQAASEFLFVPTSGACIHVPPPPPNQIIQVLMQERRKVNISIGEPIWLTGRLRLEYTNSAFGRVAFQMNGMTVQPYRE
jgi:hypothetical protein